MPDPINDATIPEQGNQVQPDAPRPDNQQPPGQIPDDVPDDQHPDDQIIPDDQLALDDQIHEPNHEPDNQPGTRRVAWVISGVITLIIVIGAIIVLSGGSTKKAEPATTDAGAAVTPAPTSSTFSIFGTKVSRDGPKPSPAQVESLARMNPSNLLEMIQQKAAEKEIWNFQVKGLQEATMNLAAAAMSLTDKEISVKSPNSSPDAEKTSKENVQPSILDTILTEVRVGNKNLTDHRAGARASHNQAVAHRNRIEKGIEDIDTQISMARAEMATAKEELKVALATGGQSAIQSGNTNLRQRIEALERLEKSRK